MVVEVRGVSKVYTRKAGSRVPALTGATLQLGPGQMMVVSGPSGSGKSTLLRLVAGEERPTEGAVLVDGVDVGALGRRGLARLRRRLAIIPQAPRLIGDRTALGNITVVLRALGASPGEARARAASALREAGLTARSASLPVELAAGERQRLVVARALASAPQLLLADEPTGALDPAATREIVALLRAAQARGTAMLVATRDAGLAAALGGSALTLDGGRMGREGEAHVAS